LADRITAFEEPGSSNMDADVKDARGEDVDMED
jgi:hypothetical protein